MKLTLTVGAGGGARAIYSPAAVAALDHVGQPQVRRASRVDVFADLRPAAAAEVMRLNTVWNDNDFFVDLSPVAGPVLGPYPTYSEAVAAEVAWLNENYL